MDENQKKTRFGVLAFVVFVVGLLFSFCDYVVYQEYIDVTLFKTIPFKMALYLLFLIVSALLFIFSYAISLNPYRKRRPYFSLYISAWGLLLQIATLYCLNNKDFEDVSIPLMVFVIVCILIIPLYLINLYEKLVRLFYQQLGDKYYRAEIYPTALKYYNQLFNYPPVKPIVKNKLGKIYFKTGRYDMAKNFLLPFVDNINDQETNKYLAIIYYKNEEWEKAKEYYEVLRTNNLSDEELDYQYAKVLRHLGEIDNSIDAILKLLTKKPNNIEWLKFLIELYAIKKDWDAVFREYKKIANIEGKPYEVTINGLTELCEKFPENISMIEYLGELYEKIGNDESAMECYEKVLDQKPESSSLRQKVINFYKSKDEISKAITHLYKLISFENENMDAVIQLGDLLADEGKENEQLELYLKYDSLNPNNYQIKYRLSEINFHNAEFNKALEYVADALKNAPEDKKASLQKLRQDIKQKITLLGLKQIKESVYNNPQNLNLRIDYVKKLAKIQDSSQVVIELNEILTHSSGNKELIIGIINEIEKELHDKFTVFQFLADLFLREGNYDKYYEMILRMSRGLLRPEEKILEGCESILKVNPNFLPAIEWLGEHMREIEQWEEMLKYYKRYFEVSGRKPLIMLKNMFRSYLILGKEDEVINCGKDILNQDSKDTEVLREIGKILKEREEYNKALDYLDKVKKLDNQDREAIALHKEVLETIKLNRIKDLEKELENESEKYDKHYELALLYFDFKKMNEAIQHFQRAVHSDELRDLSKTYLALCLVKKGLADIAFETIQDVELAYGTDEKSNKLKELFYEIGANFEKNMKDDKAETIYKKIFMIDASFRDIVTKIEKYGR